MNINDYSLQEVMPVAIKRYGHDEAMEACTTMEELAESIGKEQVEACIEEL